MKCHFCPQDPTGLNYRPSPDLNNALACEKHKTNLYIPFPSSQNTQQKKKNDQFFGQLYDIVLAQFNLLKEDVQNYERSKETLNSQKSEDYQICCESSEPYSLIHDNKDLMVKSLAQNIIKRFKRKNNFRSRSGSMTKKSYIFQTPKLSLGSMKKSCLTSISSHREGTKKLYDLL